MLIGQNMLANIDDITDGTGSLHLPDVGGVFGFKSSNPAAVLERKNYANVIN